MALWQLPATALSAMLSRGETSSREILLAHLDPHRPQEPTGGSTPSPRSSEERALDDADASDARRKRGESRGPLDGLPVTFKECASTSRVAARPPSASRRGATGSRPATPPWSPFFARREPSSSVERTCRRRCSSPRRATPSSAAPTTPGPRRTPRAGPRGARAPPSPPACRRSAWGPTSAGAFGRRVTSPASAASSRRSTGCRCSGTARSWSGKKPCAGWAGLSPAPWAICRCSSARSIRGGCRRSIRACRPPPGRGPRR